MVHAASKVDSAEASRLPRYVGIWTAIILGPSALLMTLLLLGNGDSCDVFCSLVTLFISLLVRVGAVVWGIGLFIGLAVWRWKATLIQRREATRRLSRGSAVAAGLLAPTLATSAVYMGHLTPAARGTLVVGIPTLLMVLQLVAAFALADRASVPTAAKGAMVVMFASVLLTLPTFLMTRPDLPFGVDTTFRDIGFLAFHLGLFVVVILSWNWPYASRLPLLLLAGAALVPAVARLAAAFQLTTGSLIIFALWIVLLALGWLSLGLVTLAPAKDRAGA